MWSKEFRLVECSHHPPPPPPLKKTIGKSFLKPLSSLQLLICLATCLLTIHSDLCVYRLAKAKAGVPCPNNLACESVSPRKFSFLFSWETISCHCSPPVVKICNASLLKDTLSLHHPMVQWVKLHWWTCWNRLDVRAAVSYVP